MIYYRLLIAGILLMPVVSTRAHVANPCSFTHTVSLYGFDGKGIGGTVCYEQYYNLLKCIQNAGIR